MMQCTPVLLLLWCSCLLPSSGNTLGQEKGVVVFAAEGSDVILPCSLSSKENIEYKAFDWKKQQTTQNNMEVFFYDHGSYYGKGREGQDNQFKGRVLHFPDELKFGNASITIRKTKKTDSGNYTCYFPTVQPRQLFHIELVVEGSGVINTPKDRSGELPGAAKPSITSVYNTEGMVQLQCEVQGASPKPNLHWEDSEGNILDAEEPKETERGGSYDITLNINVTKTGDYHCVVTQEINHRAGTSVSISGAAKPSITTVYQTAEMALLQCEGQGASPKPNLHWEDSEGNILDAEEPKETERGGSYDIILNITVTKTGYYHCVVTQEDINHRADTRTHVFINGKQPCTYGIGEIIGLVVLFLLGVLLREAILRLPAVKFFRNICRSCQRNTSNDADHPVKDNMSTDNDPASQCMLEMKQANGTSENISR